MENYNILIIQVALFLGYVAFIWARYDVLSSISASSYRLRGNQKGIFTAWLVLMAFTMLGYIYQDVMPVWAGMMAIGFAVTGMSPDHRSNPNSLEDAFHTGGTLLTIAAGFAGLYLAYSVWVPMLTFIGGATALYIWAPNRIWWIEILAMATIAWGFLRIS